MNSRSFDTSTPDSSHEPEQIIGALSKNASHSRRATKGTSVKSKAARNKYRQILREAG